MWKTFRKDNEVFLIKYTFGETHEFYLTDLERLWVEDIDSNDLQERFQTLNPLYVDANVTEELENLINNASNETLILTRHDNNVKVEIKTLIDGFPLKYYWELEVQSSDALFQVFTLNLINTIQYLELEQQRLHQVLERKDKEIDEYKKEYGEITRDVLKTEKFVKKDGGDCAEKELLLSILTNKETFPLLMNKYGSEAVKRKSKSLEKNEPKRKKLKPYQRKNAK